MKDLGGIERRRIWEGVKEEGSGRELRRKDL